MVGDYANYDNNEYIKQYGVWQDLKYAMDRAQSNLKDAMSYAARNLSEREGIDTEKVIALIQALSTVVKTASTIQEMVNELEKI